MPSMTITTTTEQANRIAAAVGEALDLNRAATAAEVKEWSINQLRQLVLRYERRQAAAAITDTPLDPS